MTQSSDKAMPSLNDLFAHWGPVIALSALAIQLLTCISLVTYLWHFDPDLARLVSLGDLSLTAIYGASSSSLLVIVYLFGARRWIRDADIAEIKWKSLRIVILMWPALFTLSGDIHALWSTPEWGSFFTPQKSLHWGAIITLNFTAACLLLGWKTRDVYFLLNFTWSSILSAVLIGAYLAEKKQHSGDATHVVETSEKNYENAKMIAALSSYLIIESDFRIIAVPNGQVKAISKRR